MYVKKTLIEHEMNRIAAVNKTSGRDMIERAKIKLEVMHDLEIMETTDYLNEVERLNNYLIKPAKKNLRQPKSL